MTNDLQSSWDNTGVGGNYNTVNTVAQDLIVDSLAWWRDAMGVDGFRFDLAAVLGNTCVDGCFHFDKIDPKTALNRLAREFTGTPLIAEPWAIGDGTYQVGNFPAGWSDWNDKFATRCAPARTGLALLRSPPANLPRAFPEPPICCKTMGGVPGNP